MADEHNYCQYCGARLRPGASFCNQCGAYVREHVPAPGPPPSQLVRPDQRAYGPPPGPVPPSPAPPGPIVSAPVVVGPTAAPLVGMPLFDSRRRYYVIDRRWWGWGSGDIYDEKGTKIGHMYRRLVSIRRTTEFREADDRTISATINRKIAAIRDTLDIKDGQENMLARVKQKILAVIHPVVWMEDANGKKIFEAQGNFLGFSFKVYDMSGNVVAQIDKTDMWKDIFVGGSAFDFSQKYAVVIYSDTVDRRLIIPLAIAIDEAIHEDRKGRG
nr:LURP-one-related family protein [Candidatus Njordarchaeota archaeon]